MKIHAILVLFAAFIGCPPAFAAEKASPPPLETMLEQASVSGRVGALVFDFETGETLESVNPDAAFPPASVIKAATALYALDALGPDYRFKTELRSTGAMSGDILRGDVWLVGGGDPTLDTERLAGMVAALRAKGVKRVEGGFYFDAGDWPQAPAIEARQPAHAAYNPGVSSLNLNYNRALLRWTKQGSEIVAFSDAMTAPAPSIGLTVAAGEADKPLVRSDSAAGEVWRVDPGAMRGAAQRWLPVRKPARYVAETLRALGALGGVVLPVPQPRAAPEGASLLLALESDPLRDILRGMLKYSTNLSAEMVGIAASRSLGLRPASLEESAAAMRGWMVAGDPHADWEGLTLANHSGLSLRNAVTPRQMARALQWGRARYGDEFLMLLPSTPIGADKKLAWAAHAFDSRAKSGTMYYARGYAGALRAGERLLGFAIFINDEAERAALDARFDPDILLEPAAAKRWLRRARELEIGLMRRWAAVYAQ